MVPPLVTMALIGLMLIAGFLLGVRMFILEWIVWGVGLSYFLLWCFGIRTMMRNVGSITMATVLTTVLFLVSLIITFQPGYSKPHLVWLFPVCFVVGSFTTIIYIRLLHVPLVSSVVETVWVPCRVFLWIVCLGVTPRTASSRWSRLALRAHCGKCKKRFGFTEDQAGATVECPHCGSLNHLSLSDLDVYGAQVEHIVDGSAG